MNTKKDVWGEGYRVFLSHESNAKVKAAKFKSDLEFYGITVFLAHEDITPTRLWEEEIMKALATMNAFVPLLTKAFHGSNWTDQEIGFALCRKVPIIPVRLGFDPYGFIGKVHAITSGWENAPLEIVRILIDKDPAMIEAYIERVIHCESWNDGNRLAEVLDAITSLTEKQEARLVGAFNDNYEVRNSYGFNGKWSRKYGEGLAKHLQRITGKEYYCVEQEDGQIFEDPPF